MKKMLAIVVCILMTVSVFPITVFSAEEYVPYIYGYDVDTPVPGHTPDRDNVPFDNTIAGTTTIWYDVQAGRQLEGDATFVDGREYGCMIYFSMKSGYYFDERTIGYINYSEARLTVQNKGHSGILEARFICQAPDPIKGPSVSVKEPVAGGLPSHEVTCMGSHYNAHVEGGDNAIWYRVNAKDAELTTDGELKTFDFSRLQIMEDGETFKPGYTYGVMVAVYPDTDYSFLDGTGLYINSDVSTPFLSLSTGVMGFHLFEPVAGNVTRVDFVNTQFPEAGKLVETPVFETPFGDTLIPALSAWARFFGDEESGTDYGFGKISMDVADVFRCGETYLLDAWFGYGSENVSINESFEFYVNGEKGIGMNLGGTGVAICANQTPLACPGEKFTDMPAKDNWAHDPLDFAVANGLLGGTSETTISPSNTMTRAMLVTVLWRNEGSPVEGENVFTDVPDGQWYTDAVAWANKNGIVGGVGDGKFNPNGAITREQLATILYRYAGFKGVAVYATTDISSFPDAASVNSWSETALKWAVATELIGGIGENGVSYLRPQGNATRAQVATILERYIVRNGK